MAALAHIYTCRASLHTCGCVRNSLWLINVKWSEPKCKQRSTRIQQDLTELLLSHIHTELFSALTQTVTFIKPVWNASITTSSSIQAVHQMKPGLGRRVQRPDELCSGDKRMCNYVCLSGGGGGVCYLNLMSAGASSDGLLVMPTDTAWMHRGAASEALHAVNTDTTRAGHETS